MSKRVLLTVVDSNPNNAGPKAKNDIEEILAQEGYQDMRLPYNWESKIAKFKYKYWSIPRLFKNKEIDELVMQFPIYSRALMDAFIENFRKYSNGKVFFIIHDIESLRFFKDDPSYVEKEVQWLKEADGIVSHNQSMEKWVRSQGVQTPIVNLGLFDYLNPQPIDEDFTYNKTVCLAGNLRKSNFLKQLDMKDAKLKVFGPNAPKTFGKGVEYQGQFSPEELPKHLKSNFGLIWDGDSLETCTGQFGDYMKYNCPHKASLYLSTGIPVIVWKEAAVAQYLVEHHLGIAIDNLTTLPKVLNQITPDEYKAMKQNAIEAAHALRNGEHIKMALNELEKEM